MKLTTAFKLSALVAALISAGTVHAVTVNPETELKKEDKSANQYVDFGGSTKSDKVGVANETAPVLVSEYEIAGSSEKYYLVTTKSDVSSVYKLDQGSKALVATNDKTVDQVKAGTLTRAGTSSTITEQAQKTTTTTKRIDETKLVYGETSTTTSGVGTGTVAVIDSKAQNPEKFDLAGVGGQVGATLSDKVEVGIIKDVSDADAYGLRAENGSQITTVKAGEITAKNGANVTTVKAGEITTGTITVASIKLDGEDLTVKITAAETNAKAYTDTKAIDTLAKADVAAKAYTDTKATATLAEAKAADAANLTEAKNYTDAAVSSFSSTINKLGKRLDDIEETAYRGTAIALAAAQTVPNIKPGQFALFGGVGHYESESAVAFGGVYAVSDTVSISGALGTAGSEVGGRVGASFIFGGN